MLRRDFNKVAAFWSTTFLIVVNFIYFPKWYHERNLVEEHHVNSWFNCLHFLFYLFEDFHIIRHHCFGFFSYCFTAEVADVRDKDCVSVFILVTLIIIFLNVLPRIMRSKSATDGRPTILYADLAFSASRISRFVKPSLFYWTVCMNVMSRFFLLGLQLW